MGLLLVLLQRKGGSAPKALPLPTALCMMVLCLSLELYSPYVKDMVLPLPSSVLVCLSLLARLNTIDGINHSFTELEMKYQIYSTVYGIINPRRAMGYSSRSVCLSHCLSVCSESTHLDAIALCVS